MKFIAILILSVSGLCLSQAGRAYAQDRTEPTIEEQVPDEIVRDPRSQILTLAIENDSLGGGSDRHFTSGVRLTYLDLNARFPATAHRLAELIPTFAINETTSLVYSIGQNLYTPEDITSRTADPDDRPWAAHSYFSLGMVSLTDNHVDEIEGTIGVVGPWALGKEAQKFVHSVINSPDPKGWGNQLKTEPGLGLSWERRWPEWAKLETTHTLLTLDPYAGAMVGNVHTYANAGLAFRLGGPGVRWEDLPLRVRPGAPGSGFFSPPEGWDFFVFGSAEGRAVARNIFLDGNSLRDGPHVDKKYLVSDFTLGAALTKGPARLSYSVVWRSEEFKGQSEPDVFGALSLGLRF